MEDEKMANGKNGYKHLNGNGYAHTNGNGSVSNGSVANYVTAKNEPVEAYYSNGVNNGFVKDVRLNGLTHRERDRGQKDQWFSGTSFVI